MRTNKERKMEIFKIKNKRLFVKSMIWEGIAFVIAVLFYWFWFGTFTQSLLAGIIFWIIKSAGLYYYLKFWKRTQWLKD